ncbi:MAG TPA: peptide-methionine (S)-S-oxide reductase, partial [Jatrophihabitantaceae bacterium]
MLFSRKTELVSPERALKGHADYTFTVPDRHYVNGRPIKPPFPDGLETIIFGLGCFWGAEEIFWQTPGVWTTAVGYAGGITPHPSYEEVCSGRTGHTEAVLVVYDPKQVSLAQLMSVF